MPEAPPTAPKTVILHLLAGAIPPAIAIVLGLWQTLEPFVSTQHRGMLYIGLLAGLIAPMAVAVWCKVDHSQRISAAADKAALERDKALRDDLAAACDQIHSHDNRVESNFDKLAKSMRGVHHHLARHDEALAENKAEIEHIRNLMMANDPPQFGHQRLGPRSLS